MIWLISPSSYLGYKVEYECLAARKANIHTRIGVRRRNKIQYPFYIIT